MARLRCYPILPDVPGTLYLVTIQLLDNSAPILPECMSGALDRWQRLFTTKVIHYILSDVGVTMLIYVPGKLLTADEATQRNNDYDHWLLEIWEQTKHKGNSKKGIPRTHDFSAEKLGNLSEFMKLFKPDLRARHRYFPRPKDLLPGISKVPVYRHRFTADIVQHTAMPPVFPFTDMAIIEQRLAELGFENKASSCRSTDLYQSQHGIGSLKFLLDLEERCYIMLKSMGREPKLWQRFKNKYITPITQEAINQRLGDLILQEEYEEYPKMWSLLQTLDELTDKLMDPNNISISVPMPAPRRNNLVTACLPFSLTLLLTDGLLRWYYKKTKDVEFPHYNYYRRLLPWEVRHGSRH